MNAVFQKSTFVKRKPVRLSPGSGRDASSVFGRRAALYTSQRTSRSRLSLSMYVIETQHQGFAGKYGYEDGSIEDCRAPSVVDGVIYSVVVLPGLCP